MQVYRHLDPKVFLSRAESFLIRAEAENNVMLSIGGSSRMFGEDCYFATVEDAGEIVACAMRTPPYKAIITRGEPKALECLVDDIVTKYETLPAVLGPEPAVRHFAELWSARVGTPARLGMRQRLFETREVQPLPSRPAGTLRLAEEADLPIITLWVEAFIDEAHVSDPYDPHQVARERVDRRS